MLSTIVSVLFGWFLASCVIALALGALIHAGKKACREISARKIPLGAITAARLRINPNLQISRRWV
jgi:hypothetical protein